MGWNRGVITTKNGCALDECVSALQKSIRRGREEDAAYWALELVDSGMGKYLWRRLLTIAFEDIGIAAPDVCQLVVAGWLATKEVTKSWDAMKTEFLGTVLLAMCRAPKSREGDDYTWLMALRRQRGLTLEVPDYALDEHTAQGRALQRGRDFWFEQGARVEQPAVPAPNHYGHAVRQLLETEAGERSVARGNGGTDENTDHEQVERQIQAARLVEPLSNPGLPHLEERRKE